MTDLHGTFYMHLCILLLSSRIISQRKTTFYIYHMQIIKEFVNSAEFALKANEDSN